MTSNLFCNQFYIYVFIVLISNQACISQSYLEYYCIRSIFSILSKSNSSISLRKISETTYKQRGSSQHEYFKQTKDFPVNAKRTCTFKYLQHGHLLKKKKLPFDLPREKRYFQSLAEVFNSDFFNQHATHATADQSVVFVIGMPRSGTSLTEQILASHTAVYGAGELSLIAETRREIAKLTGRSFPQNCNLIDEAHMELLGLSYLKDLKKRSPKAEIITDTNPMNFLYTGLIAALLPNARFINCVRNPMDNCLSIFKHLLAEPHAYSHDLEDLGAYFNLHRSLMRHWHETLPDRIYDLPYETLVANSENEIRKLLEFCRLPFEENCLQFHKTSRVVRTPSASQVRQPLYTDTINLWKRYEQQLRPLQATLNREETHDR